MDRDTTGAPDGVSAVAAELVDADAVRDAVGRVGDALGGLDVLVKNAGIGAMGDISANEDAEWLRVLDVDVVGIARVTRAALPWLRRSEHAVIVNTCSAVAHVGVPNRALYSASLGAVEALTLATAADHVREGIRVNAVSPGTADTQWVGRILSSAETPEAAAAALRARQPMDGSSPLRRSRTRSPQWHHREPARLLAPYCASTAG